VAISPSDPDIRLVLQKFPRLTLDNFEKTSDETIDYNCLAWALHETHRKWDPSSDQYYWPKDADPNALMVTLIGILKARGFSMCPDGSLEKGFEKIAIYSDTGDCWDHVARQLPDGKWTSKLGELIDITHASLEPLTRWRYKAVYGEVKWFMKKPTGGDSGKTEAKQAEDKAEGPASQVAPESVPVPPPS
jgi:hypothetical protein